MPTRPTGWGRDMDVYDTARGSAPVEFPDFTRDRWRDARTA